MQKPQTITLPILRIKPNKGQIDGLPANPRIIKDDKYRKLKASIEENPEMLELRPLLVYEHKGEYIIIGGNMRYRACKELGYKELPCIIIPPEATIEQLRAYTIKDNNGFGEWDYDMLANEWDAVELDDWGVDVWQDAIEEPESNANDEDDTTREKFTAEILFNSSDEVELFITKYKDILIAEFGCKIIKR